MARLVGIGGCKVEGITILGVSGWFCVMACVVLSVGYSSSWLGLACVGYGWVLRVGSGMSRVWLGLAGSPTRNCRLGDSPGWPALAPAVVADHHLLDQAILVFIEAA